MSDIAPAVPTAEKKATKPREEVFSKDDLVVSLQSRLKENLGISLSKANVWELYKLGFAVSYELAATKPLSLSGIGRFSVLSSKRSEEVGKPALRMRFRTSARTSEILNGDKNFYADLHKVSEKSAAPEGTGVPAVETAAPDAPAPAAPAPTNVPLI